MSFFDGNDPSSDLMSLTQEALDLASVAVHFDQEENYVGAYDYYDKCILTLDEILSKLPPMSSQWQKCIDLRNQYDDRMDMIKEMGSNRGTFLGFGSSSSNNTQTNASPMRSGASAANNNTPNQKKIIKTKLKLQEEFAFHEIPIVINTIDSSTSISPSSSAHSESQLTHTVNSIPLQLEEIPQNMLEVPYWTLRNIMKSIENTDSKGYFLTPSLFIPQKIWLQHDVKFSGIHMKITAFEMLIKCIQVNDIEGLYFAADEDSINYAESVFLLVEEEIANLRNSLSKFFPYIKEHSNLNSPVPMNAPGNSSGSNGNAFSGTANAGVEGESVLSTSEADSSTAATPANSNNSNAVETASTSDTGSEPGSNTAGSVKVSFMLFIFSLTLLTFTFAQSLSSRHRTTRLSLSI
jgi:hypothetical protein